MPTRGIGGGFREERLLPLLIQGKGYEAITTSIFEGMKDGDNKDT